MHLNKTQTAVLAKDRKSKTHAAYDFRDIMNNRLTQDGHPPLTLSETEKYRVVGYSAEEAAETILYRDY